MSIYTLLDWRFINLAVPFIGLISCAYLFFSHKTCTKRVAVSTAVALSLMFWLMLTWADWGSLSFVASYQTMWARVILLVISLLIAYELRYYTRLSRFLRAKNNQLQLEKKQLHAIIHRLETQLTHKDESK